MRLNGSVCQVTHLNQVDYAFKVAFSATPRYSRTR